MNIENIFDDIRFKVSPKDDYRSSYKFRFIKSFYKIFKKEKNYVFNNCIINKEKIDLDLRKELIKIDSMSTYAIGYLINRICKNLSKNQVYLNILTLKLYMEHLLLIEEACSFLITYHLLMTNESKNTLHEYEKIFYNL